MAKNTIQNLISSTNKNGIKSQELNIFQIFESKNIFSIKEFQRKYEWGKTQFLELLDEINEKNSSEDYFLGMIILKKEYIDDKNVSLSVVDGQQRITTLFLISKAIEISLSKFVKNIYDKPLEEFSEEEKEIFEYIKELKNIYSIQDESRINKLKISKIRGEDELSDILLRGETNSEKYRISETNNFNPIYFNPFQNILEWFKFKKNDEINKFLKKFKSINFSVVVLGESINEYKVFEDLNSKGVDLKIDDLIRNFFAQKATKFATNPNMSLRIIDTYEILLRKIEIFLKNEKKEHRGYFSAQIGRWFKNYILYKLNYKKTLSDKNDKRMYGLYKEEMINKIYNVTDLTDEIDSIKEYLEFCEWINTKSNNEKYLINDIDMYPIYFEFYRNAKKYKYDIDNLTKILTPIYITSICNNENIGNMNQMYLEDIKMEFYLSKTSDEKLLFEDISKKIVIQIMKFNEENIKTSILKKISEDSSIFEISKMKRFIFYFYASKLKYDENIDVSLWSGKWNIEHIIPQKPDWSEIKDEEDKIRNLNLWFINVNRIKNLALIETEINEKLGNNFYDKKKEIVSSIESSDISESTKKIFSLDKFEENELISRQKEILKYTRDIFINEISLFYSS